MNVLALVMDEPDKNKYPDGSLKKGNNLSNAIDKVGNYEDYKR